MIAFLCGLWANSRASRKAKEPFAPVISIADYYAIFLWLVAAVIILVANNWQNLRASPLARWLLGRIKHRRLCENASCLIIMSFGATQK